MSFRVDSVGSQNLNSFSVLKESENKSKKDVISSVSEKAFDFLTKNYEKFELIILGVSIVGIILGGTAVLKVALPIIGILVIGRCFELNDKFKIKNENEKKKLIIALVEEVRKDFDSYYLNNVDKLEKMKTTEEFKEIFSEFGKKLGNFNQKYNKITDESTRFSSLNNGMQKICRYFKIMEEENFGNMSEHTKNAYKENIKEEVKKAQEEFLKIIELCN